MNTTEKDYSNYLRMPHHIFDTSIKVLKPTEWKVFMFLSREAIFIKDSDHYSLCWFTFKQIEEGTGVKAGNMDTHVTQLKKEGFIDVIYHNHPSRTEGFKTSHRFQILWMKPTKSPEDITINVSKPTRRKRSNRKGEGIKLEISETYRKRS
jgi:hypothetical protein